MKNIKIWAFPLIYITWAFFFWSFIILSKESIWIFPNIIFFLLGGASPLVATFILIFFTENKYKFQELFLRLIDIKRINLYFLIIILLFWPLFDILMVKMLLFFGFVSNGFNIVWSLFSEPFSLIFILILSFVFPTIEEIGLRGYWLDILQQRYTPITSAFINGTTWALWHTPFVWFTGYYANTNFNPQLWWWLPSIILHSLLIVWIYNKTNRSILSVVLFHGMMNFTGEFLGLSAEVFPYMLVGYFFIAVVLIFSWKNSK